MNSSTEHLPRLQFRPHLAMPIVQTVHTSELAQMTDMDYPIYAEGVLSWEFPCEYFLSPPPPPPLPPRLLQSVAQSR